MKSIAVGFQSNDKFPSSKKKRDNLITVFILKTSELMKIEVIFSIIMLRNMSRNGI